MAESEPIAAIRAIILCSWGATSSTLAGNVHDAALRRGLDVTVDAGGTGEFKNRVGDYDVALLEPQVRHMQHDLEAIGASHRVPVALIDHRAFALMNGDTVLDQILSLVPPTARAAASDSSVQGRSE